MEPQPPLIHTKVSIPILGNLMSRARLLDLLREYVRRKLVLVCAGPGYGKTSLLAEFARTADFAVCWYTLDTFDSDPRIFLEYLVEAIRVRFPAFGERTGALIEQGRVDLRSVVGVLTNELAALAEPLVLVLDEYQHVDTTEEVDRILALLLAFLPPNIHLIVASRVAPKIPVIAMVAHREVAAIGPDLLRFTWEEVRDVLDEHYGVQLDEDRARELTERSEGWITGIVLGAEGIWQHLASFLSRLREPADRIYDYMLQEVQKTLAPDVRDFLVQVSVLSRLEASFCDALLGRGDSRQVLELLEQRNLFLIPLQGGWYRFHGLFRESLLRDARGDWKAFVELNLRAARLWRERGETAEAVEHFLAARALGEAADVVVGQLPDLYRRGQLQTLVRWVTALGPAEAESRPALLVFLGKAYLETGKQEQAMAALEQSERLLEHGDDPVLLARVWAAKSLSLRQQGAYTEALRIAIAALPTAEQAGASAAVDLRRTMGICLAAQGDLAGAEEHFRAAVETSSTVLSLYDRALAYQDLGVCLRAQGRVQDAEQSHRQALALWREIGNPGPTANTLNNLAMGPFLCGDFETAGTLLREALEVAEQSLVPYFRALVRASLGDLHQAEGDLAVAREVYLEGLALAEEANHTALINYVLEALGNLSRQLGAYGEARRYLEQAWAAASSAPADQARVLVSLALLAASEGRLAEAEQKVEEAVRGMEQSGDRLHQVRARLVQAFVRHSFRRMDAARDSFHQAVELAAPMGLVEPFLVDSDLVLPLLEQVGEDGVEDGIEAAFLRDLRERLELRCPRWPVPFIAGGRIHFKVLVLGADRVLRGGVEITPALWRGKLPREMFFYLVFHAPVSKERLCAEFWPEAGSEQAASRVHRLVSRVRQAIGADVIIFEGDTYRWRPEVTWWRDVDVFLDLARRAESQPADSPQLQALLEQAVALYRGDFLEDLYRDWCAPWREELRTKHLAVLLRLARLRLAAGDHLQARDLYEAALQSDAYCEEAYRGLMRCFAEAGERTMALNAYRRCRRLLKRELGVAPAEETVSLREAIARGEPLPPLARS
jgi:ATP/maltotriose-dependent transcriptional regulator MalT/DNA-binding SARP family transcriptional activator